MKLLTKGDRIRLKVPTILGWRGEGTVSKDQWHKDDAVHFIKDGGREQCSALPHEVSIIRQKKTS